MLIFSTASAPSCDVGGRDEPDGSFGCKGAPDRDGPALLELAYDCRKAVEPPPAPLATPLDGRAHELVGNEQHRSTIASGRAIPGRARQPPCCAPRHGAREPDLAFLGSLCAYSAGPRHKNLSGNQQPPIIYAM